MVNVGDTARLHVAALTDAQIVGERIFGFAETYTNRQIVAALKKAKPEFEFPEDTFDDAGQDLSTVEARGRADEILKKHFGRGFRGLDESVAESVEGL